MLDLDPVLFEQALFNLLDNAAKYSPPGTLVHIESWQEGDTVKLEVADEGSGIPAEEIDRIFEKFHRAQKGGSRSGRHRSWPSHRPRLHRGACGGSIKAANRSDRQGAVFTITMPIPKRNERLDTAA